MSDDTLFRPCPFIDTTGAAHRHASRQARLAAVTPYSPLGHRPELDAELARAQGWLPEHPAHGERRLGDPRSSRFCENDGHWIDCDEPADEDRCPCCEEPWT